MEAPSRLCGPSCDCCCIAAFDGDFQLSADNFTQHFAAMTDRIRASTSSSPPPVINDRVVNQLLSHLAPVTPDEVTKMLQKSPAKQCKLDPTRTWLVKRASHVLAPVIAAVCNASFQQLTFPSRYKNAIVRPLLKKRTIDLNDLAS